jgi:guanine deaminase
MEEHRKWLLEAIKISEQGFKMGKGGPFGAIIVKNGQVVGRGWNQVTSTMDPTAHAEVVAIRDACGFLKNFQLEDCIIYTSCEPCPMCLGAIYWARPKAIYYANTRDNAAAIGFDDSFIYEEIPKPIAERSIPTIHIQCDEAWEVFKEWQNKSDKISY